MITCTTYLHIASLHLSIFHYPFYITLCKSPSFSLFSVFNTLKLALSILKTNFDLFHSKRLKLYKSINLKIDGVNIQEVSTVKYLNNESVETTLYLRY